MERSLQQITAFSADMEANALAVENLKYKGFIRNRIRVIQASIMEDLNDYMESKSNIIGTRENDLSGVEAALNTQASVVDHNRRNANQKIREKARIKKEHLSFLIKSMGTMGNVVANIGGSKSILFVSGGGYMDSDTSAMYYRMTSSLATQQVMVHSLLSKDARYLSTQNYNFDMMGDLQRSPFIGFGNNTGTDGESMNSRNTVMENTRQMESGPSNVASRTGGAFYKTQTYNKIGQGLKFINQQASHYYILRFRTSGSKHSIKINVSTSVEKNLFYAKKIAPPVPYGQLNGGEQELAFITQIMYGEVTNDEFLKCAWGFDLFGTEKEGFSIACLWQNSIPLISPKRI